MGNKTEEFLINLSYAQSAIDLILKLGKYLEQEKYKNKKIKLNLGNIDLNDSQMLSIKSFIGNVDSEIAIIFTESSMTQMAALNIGLLISDEETERVCQCEVDCNCPDETNPEQLALNLENEKKEQVDNQEIVKYHQEQETLYLQQTLRSGQSVIFDGNVVIIGDCHAGSEVIATGDITIWGVLNGIAHSGAKGDENSKIRALKMNAIQLRIAGYFARKPDQIEVEKIERAQAFIPEEAKISDGEIIIYTLNE